MPPLAAAAAGGGGGQGNRWSLIGRRTFQWRSRAGTAAAGTLAFTREVIFPLGTTIGAGCAYAIRDASGTVTDWSTNGLTVTPGMTGSATQSPGYSINWTVSANKPDGSFAGILIARSHSSGAVYDVQPLNIQATSAPVASQVTVVSVAPFLSTDTMMTPGVRAYQGTSALELRRTTGIVAISEVTNGYFTEHALTPAANGSFDGYALWDEDNTLFLPVRLRFDAYQPGVEATTFCEVFQFPTGTTVGSGLAYEVRGTSGTVVTPWTTVGLNAVPGVTPSGTQPPCYSIDGTIAANHPDGSFTGYVIIRSDTGGMYLAKPLNTQAYLPASTIFIADIAPFLTTDVVTSAGRRPYSNSVGTVTALEARTTATLTAIPEISNGYVTLLSLTPAADGSAAAVMVYDGGTEPYSQNAVFFPSSNGVAPVDEASSTLGGRGRRRNRSVTVEQVTKHWEMADLLKAQRDAQAKSVEAKALAKRAKGTAKSGPSPKVRASAISVPAGPPADMSLVSSGVVAPGRVSAAAQVAVKAEPPADAPTENDDEFVMALAQMLLSL